MTIIYITAAEPQQHITPAGFKQHRLMMPLLNETRKKWRFKLSF